jgi:hypothetical protein
VRRWPAIALASYLAASLVVVVALFAVTVADLPQIAAKVGDVFRHHAAVLHDAVAKREFLISGAVAVELALLGLIVVAVAFLVYRGTRTAAAALLHWSRGSVRRRAVGLVAATAAAAATALLWSTGFFWAPRIPLSPGKSAAAPAGTQTFDIESAGKANSAVTYDVHPAVGGRYAPQWQTCGFYSTPVDESRAVHSLARGAVWIAYRPTISSPERTVLRALTRQLDYVLATPYKGLKSRFVLTAWGKQLALDSLADPRIGQFIAAFRLSGSAPESGKPCTSGAGRPAR